LKWGADHDKNRFSIIGPVQAGIRQTDLDRGYWEMEVCMKKPDEDVAERILQQFRQAKLLSEDAVKRIGLSLSVGELRPEDWRLMVEADRLMKEDEDASKGQ
jgi:hypothetical protein